jgi:hypothetical protein
MALIVRSVGRRISYVVFGLRLILCSISFLFVAVHAPGLSPFRGQLLVPAALGLLWVVLTVWMFLGTSVRMGPLLFALLELPFAFGWPAWIILMVLLSRFSPA